MKTKTESQIIKSNLLALGVKIADYASANARVSKDVFRKRDGVQTNKGGTLRDSHNYRVTENELKVFYRFYGKYQKPNVVEVAVNKFTPKSVEVITREIKEMLLTKNK